MGSPATRLHNGGHFWSLLLVLSSKSSQFRSRLKEEFRREKSISIGKKGTLWAHAYQVISFAVECLCCGNLAAKKCEWLSRNEKSVPLSFISAEKYTPHYVHSCIHHIYHSKY